jgi:hypothetical protein
MKKKKNNKRKKHVSLKGVGRSQQRVAKTKCVTKFEKANRRRRLKVSIKLRLKKLTHVINLKVQYLG